MRRAHFTQFATLVFFVMATLLWSTAAMADIANPGGYRPKPRPPVCPLAKYESTNNECVRESTITVKDTDRRSDELKADGYSKVCEEREFWVWCRPKKVVEVVKPTPDAQNPPVPAADPANAAKPTPTLLDTLKSGSCTVAENGSGMATTALLVLLAVIGMLGLRRRVD